MAPVFLDRVLADLARPVVGQAVKPPTISSSAAAALSISYTILYVLPLYLHPTTRPAPTLSRDSPIVIQTRIRLVSLSVAFCTATTYYILSQQIKLSASTITHSLGFYPISASSVANPLLLTIILFAGPLFEKAIVENGLRNTLVLLSSSSGLSSALSALYQPFSSWVRYRNYIAAPLTEELLFRSLLLALHLHTPLPTSSSTTRLVFATPLYFGIAHIHHFYEFRLTHPFVPALPALVRSLVQFAYTTVFGWYASFLYLRMGGVWGVVVVHAFCNWMGLPRVWGRVGVLGERDDDDDDEDEDEDEDENDDDDDDGKGRVSGAVASKESGIGWTVAYYLFLVGGAVAWWRLKWVLTECEGALVDF